MDFQFNSERFNRLFPFYFLVDSNLRIISFGNSLEKIWSGYHNIPLSEAFKIKRPDSDIKSFESLKQLEGQIVILETFSKLKIVLRGQIEYLANQNTCLFIGSPWFESVEQLRPFDLSFDDFALHDPMIDLMHVLKAQKINLDEIQELLEKVNNQNIKLKQSEHNYRSIIEHASEIVYKVNIKGDFVFVNAVAERMTGYTKNELLKMNYLQFIRDDYKQKAFEFYSNQVSNNIPTTYFEFPLITKEGKEMWIGQSVQFPLDENGDIELTALALNISERKQIEQTLIFQEEKYRNIITNMNLGLLEVDNDDIIQFANQSFCNMSGYTLDELIGEKASDLFTGENQKAIIQGKNQERTKGISDMYSLQVQNKKGETKWWAISGAPRYNDNGELLGSVGIHLDITEQIKLQEDLKIAKQNAEVSSKAKESFLATMSHEIRTPLNAIVGITNLMKMNSKSRTKENLNILDFSAKNLLALITDILDLSKIDAGKIELSKNNVQIKKLISGIAQTFRPACEEKNVELLLNISKSIPELIIADELRISQILNNLLSNAVKFTPKGYIKLDIDSEPLKGDKVRIYFSVKDSGIGIQKNQHAIIFNAFEQANKKISGQFGGTGLGLSITKKLIELQGGKISIESRLNKGTTFSFFIDYSLSKNIKKQKEGEIAHPKIEPKSIKNKVVLLVEDNVVNQKVAISYLKHWGLKYAIANNGAEALELLATKHFDIALIDLFMPIMDGFETIKWIRKTSEFKSFPIIALTASAEINLMDKAIQLGANKCLTKPFNAQHLQETIAELLLNENATITSKVEDLIDEVNDIKNGLINLKKLKDASLGSETFMIEMLEIIKVEIPPQISEADTNLQSFEYLLFSKNIHKLKNSLLLLGLEFLHEDLNFMEEHSKNGKNITSVNAKFDNLKSIWKTVQSELNTIVLKSK